ncbi:hypothetical protein SBX37_16965 [Vibrio mangrovi]|nr:hypothetical protein [Vibrio mangrovi]MDW6004550.1 hypothetical protein [Vibrio mangrovi]
MSGMAVFHKQSWSEEDFKNIILNEINTTNPFKPLADDYAGKVAINIELPEESLRNSIVKIYSFVMQKNIYIGPYKEKIIISADKKMVKSEESEKYDGMDILDLSFIDKNNRITYTCEQEKIYKIWQLNKMVTIQFLSRKKLDENDQPYCYAAQITDSL